MKIVFLIIGLCEIAMACCMALASKKRKSKTITVISVISLILGAFLIGLSVIFE